jgi:hypothetical protein
MTRSPNATVLVAGLALVALGVLLVLAADGDVDLSFSFMAPAIVAALGATLLASGLAARGRRRG